MLEASIIPGKKEEGEISCSALAIAHYRVFANRTSAPE